MPKTGGGLSGGRSKRRRAREMAMQLLFQREFVTASTLQAQVPEADFLDLQKGTESSPRRSPALVSYGKRPKRVEARDRDQDRGEEEERESSKFEIDVIEYAKILSEGVEGNREEIDKLVSRFSQHWKLERMPLVDRNLIRLALCEMLFASPVLEPAIVINEVMEIAKKYSTTDSSRFINGILDQVAKQVRPKETAPVELKKPDENQEGSEEN